ncbi:hypothetical protein HMPREF6745_3091 [Prevotella sp. oral taxon 472 str. F0295]|nr:hypothetical protein HMPREF6745_3091 [Prevotella sp. oral taxon 472 str. F0295]
MVIALLDNKKGMDDFDCPSLFLVFALLFFLPIRSITSLLFMNTPRI